jgi:hypothetical protein
VYIQTVEKCQKVFMWKCHDKTLAWSFYNIFTKIFVVIVTGRNGVVVSK